MEDQCLLFLVDMLEEDHLILVIYQQSGISAVEVYKSANATLPTGGLGSTVNMVTTKPLDIDGDSIGTVSMKAYDHSKGDNITPEVDFVYATKKCW
jgi:hypothetical protein